MISTELHGHVAVAALDRGVTNALDLELVTGLAGTIRELGEDPDVRGLVLTGSNDKFFSIGFDLPHLFGLGEDEFAAFYRTFNRLCLDLFAMPKPTVAAVRGHATAGGCILALCCDYRFAAEGRKLLGLNEVKLGVPVPYPADCILRRLVGFRLAREIMDGGEFHPAAEALRMGMVDRLLPAERVVPESVEKAGSLGRSPGDAFAMIKRNRVEPVVAEVLAGLEERERSFVERWYSDEARARLKKALEKY